MLVRVLLVVANDDLPSRLEQLLGEMDALVEFAAGGERFWVSVAPHGTQHPFAVRDDETPRIGQGSISSAA